MKCIITEKPSVAREIASIIGATNKEDGFLSGNGYTVTWALGHLIQLVMPEDYGFAGFVRENLPIIPETFTLKPRQIKEGKEYKPDGGALRQLKIITRLFDSCDKIIVATDAGREGELIFRYIYNYVSCRKPFERLWISSLTERAIKDGFKNMKNGSDFDNLYQAAKARSEADWLVGINASQALSIAAGRGVFSLGRVQTPTLTMICKRFLENKNFVPVPFWQLKAQIQQAGITFSAISREKYDNKQSADHIFQRLDEQKTLYVQSVEKKEIIQEPPLLYDLTTLQKEANSKHGFSADKTLSIAQKLYEAKLITYPRTGSRYITKDIYNEIPQLIKTLHNHPGFGNYAQSLSVIVANVSPVHKVVNDQKVNDHHALLITENQPKNLSEDDKIIYEMIAGRVLESFSEKCVKDVTSITFSCEKTLFETRGSVIKQAGWRMIFGEKEETGDGESEASNLPEVQQGEHLPVIQSEVLEKQTKPKPLHTEASLLSSMQTAGKEIENEAEREAIKESGIGTPATRAAIIETLFSRDYIHRQNKSLVPTEKGLSVFETVKDKRIADVAMTGNWENTLAQIEKGETQPDTFRKAIEIYTRQITTELLCVQFPTFGGGLGGGSGAGQTEAILCPKCKTGKMIIYPKIAKCQDANCGLIIYRTISEKQLSEKQISELLTNGKTSVIKSFKSKSGKSFDASLKFDENFRVIFDFSVKKGKK